MSLSRRFAFLRPSQLISSFGPGAIYDNQVDSVIIMGLNKWDTSKFKDLYDPMLLKEIRRDSKSYDNLKTLYSVSDIKSEDEKGAIPVRSFPAWGFCRICNKLVDGRDGNDIRSLKCNSEKCEGYRKRNTVPVRFVRTCENGHLDEFPWYEWAHQKASKDACSRDEAELYLETDGSSSSMSSKRVVCKKCNNSHDMATALTKNALKFITGSCTRNMPWIGKHDSAGCSKNNMDLPMRGMFKGATNMYFPMTRSAVTVPPFSDDAAEVMMRPDIRAMISAAGENKEQLDVVYELISKMPGIECLPKDFANKQEQINDFHKDEKTVKQFEYDQLNSGTDSNDKDFTTEMMRDIPSRFRKYFDKIVLVKRTRVISAITGFSRIDSPYIAGGYSNIQNIDNKYPTWLPAVENRGEGMFFSLNKEQVDLWMNNDTVIKRIEKVMTQQGRFNLENLKKAYPEMRDEDVPKFILLHTLSHMFIRSLSKQTGYWTASFQERIYCSESMQGIFVYTSAPSSDGVLGGMVDIGTKSRINSILQNLLIDANVCSCDPLCGMQQPEKIDKCHGASCHACTLVPETCCEAMNDYLDRATINKTIHDNFGYFESDGQ
ncbi:MAG: hypothetical protein CL781_00365 [Chloroflexi bacterium]|nr:hypothetical protein [Chloroflexota bacterium]